MKKSEAYKELELPETATIEEVKKAFKTKAKKLHPDVNKSQTAEQDFKRLNEAYQRIEKNDFSDNQFGGGNWSGGFGGFDFSHLEDLFGGFNFYGGGSPKHKRIIVQDIHLEQTITFKEAVLGVNKSITFSCDQMCDKCNGKGEKLVDNGCSECKGKGRKTRKQGNMIFEESCRSCRGKVKTEICTNCSDGKIKAERTISVSIKAGITNNTILRLTGIGNFIDYSMGNSNVLLTVKVSPEKGLTLENNDVITNISITLLEALTGCSKTVNTIDGEKEIEVPKLIRNKEEVILRWLGVSRTGDERVIVNVEYPENTETLIKALENK
jgi:molecular chaperone DnaJ